MCHCPTMQQMIKGDVEKKSCVCIGHRSVDVAENILTTICLSYAAMSS